MPWLLPFSCFEVNPRARVLQTPKAVGNRLTPGQGPAERLVRLEKTELLDLLFPLFEQAPYWHAKTLGEHTKQPVTYLKEVLAEVAVLVRAGPYAGMWTLKPEYKNQADRTAKKEELGVSKSDPSASPVKAEAGGEEVSEGEDRKPVIVEDDNNDEDDEEMVFEAVA